MASDPRELEAGSRGLSVLFGWALTTLTVMGSFGVAGSTSAFAQEPVQEQVIEGRIESASGIPLAADVMILDPSNGEVLGLSEANAQGELRVPVQGLVGLIRLLVHHDGYQSKMYSVATTASDLGTVRLEPRELVSLTLVDEQGELVLDRTG